MEAFGAYTQHNSLTVSIQKLWPELRTVKEELRIMKLDSQAHI